MGRAAKPLRRVRDRVLGASLRSELGALRSQLAALETRLEEQRRVLRKGAEWDDAAGDLVAGPQALERILALERWVSRQPPSSTEISVVVPTRDRAPLLRDAIDSVRAQSHRAWQLLIAHDGHDDATADVLAGLDDPRILSFSTGGAGPAAARNAALERATGAVIAYLDDDNVMLPHWLASVAWAFERFPAIDVAYGARIVEDESALGFTGQLPRASLVPFDRGLLTECNYIDMNVLAHRAGLPEARFDATLEVAADWDLVLRLTRTRDALALPALAVLYRTSSGDRIGDRSDYAEMLERVRRRVVEIDRRGG